MKNPPLRVINKPRFVVDINTSYSILRKRYGGFATFKSVVFLTKKQNASDDEIMKAANTQNYHIITQNTKHFTDAPRKFPQLKIGIICINLNEDNFIDKFGKLLRNLKKHEKFKNNLFILGNEIQQISYLTLRNKV